MSGGTGSPSLESVLTGQGATIPTIRFDGSSTGDNYFAFGYPAAKKYRGNVLTYRSGLFGSASTVATPWPWPGT